MTVYSCNQSHTVHNQAHSINQDFIWHLWHLALAFPFCQHPTNFLHSISLQKVEQLYKNGYKVLALQYIILRILLRVHRSMIYISIWTFSHQSHSHTVCIWNTLYIWHRKLFASINVDLCQSSAYTQVTYVRTYPINVSHAIPKPFISYPAQTSSSLLRPVWRGGSDLPWRQWDDQARAGQMLGLRLPCQRDVWGAEERKAETQRDGRWDIQKAVKQILYSSVVHHLYMDKYHLFIHHNYIVMKIQCSNE